MTDRAFRDLLTAHTSLREKGNNLRAEIYSLRVDLAKARDVITNRDKQIITFVTKSAQPQLFECRHKHELAEYICEE
jgi:hypothetical protein